MMTSTATEESCNDFGIKLQKFSKYEEKIFLKNIFLVNLYLMMYMIFHMKMLVKEQIL